MDESIRTVQLHQWIERMRAGDHAARDELVRAVCGRLEVLARRMLRGFPQVQRWAQTDDVLQSALMRLLRSLEKIEPSSVRDFLGLAALEIRRELLDLARHFCGGHGIGANHQSHGPDSIVEPAAPQDDPEDLARWEAFHRGVESLPAKEREVIGLVFYHDWTQTEVAELFGVSERTVRRLWESALEKLHAKVRP